MFCLSAFCHGPLLFIDWLLVGNGRCVCQYVLVGGRWGGSGKCPWYWYTFFIGGRGVANANVLHPSYSGGQMSTPANHLGGKCPSCHFSWEGKCLGGSFCPYTKAISDPIFMSRRVPEMSMVYIFIGERGKCKCPTSFLFWGGKCPPLPIIWGANVLLCHFSWEGKCLGRGWLLSIHQNHFWPSFRKSTSAWNKSSFLIWNIESYFSSNNAINIRIFTIYCKLKFSIKNCLFHFFTICANSPGWIVPGKKSVCANHPRRNWFLCKPYPY